MRLSTPILFLVFNRPAQSLQVFEKIREQQPRQLFIAADGPRAGHATDAALCAATKKALLERVDWPCELHTRFQAENLGCGKAVSSAIQWFFETVTEGMILEDDCLPDPSFFSYCETLLQYYRHDTRMMHIAGSNYQMGIQRGNGSYYFSRYAHIWGWATWRRAWAQYDFTLQSYRQYPQAGLHRHFRTDMRAILDQQIDTWDIQWFLSVWFRQGWAIAPNVNLVRNIGCGPGATHTNKEPAWFKRMVYGSLPRVVHPAQQNIDGEADDLTTRTLFNTGSLSYQLRQAIRGNAFLYELYKRIILSV